MVAIEKIFFLEKMVVKVPIDITNNASCYSPCYPGIQWVSGWEGAWEKKRRPDTH